MDPHPITLICILGISPAIVTEAIDGVLFNEQKIITRLRVIHTKSTFILPHIVDLKDQIYKRIPDASVEFVELPYDDIYSEIEDRDFMSACLQLVLEEKKLGNHVWLSIAGGRKTMSASGLFAGYLGGADMIFHVLVKNERLYIAGPGKPQIYDVPVDQIFFIKLPVVNLFPILQNLNDTISGDNRLEEQLRDAERPLPEIFANLNNRLQEWSLHNSLRKGYEQYREKFERMVALTSTLLKAIMGAHQISADITWRVKTFDSILKKIELDQIQFNSVDQFFEEHLMNDIAGCSVICTYSDDIDRVLHLLQKDVDFICLGKKHKQKANGYQAWHLDVAFSELRLANVEYKFVRNIHCEIQVRSAMHQAWYKPNHSTYYKSEAYRNAGEDIQAAIAKHFMEAGHHVNNADEHISTVHKILDNLDDANKLPQE